MSAHDGQRIGELLRASGYSSSTSAEGADVLVLTTCSVREKARQKVYSAIGRMKRLKAGSRVQTAPVIVVAGCVAQQDGRRILDDAAHVDLVIGPDHLYRVPELVEHVRATGDRLCVVGFDDAKRSTFLPLGAAEEQPVSAYVTIQKGCDEHCAFCIVPQVRGPGRCRSPDEIIAEVEALAGRGAREIVLLGQTVNSYRVADVGFARLLGLVNEIDGIERIRYESAHPRFLTDDLIEAHVSLSLLCEHIHLPVQSGSDTMLRAMGRGHGRDEFLGWVRRLRDACPDIGVSTDLFVGFPGETEEDFQQTLALVDAAEFDSAFSFKYSPRPGTPAAKLDDDVPVEVKVDRLRRLQERQSDVTARALAELVGTSVEVLVEGESKIGGQLRGRSRQNRVVNIDLASGDSGSPGTRCRDEAALVGELVTVEVTQAGGHSVRGRLSQTPSGSEFAA